MYEEDSKENISPRTEEEEIKLKFEKELNELRKRQDYDGIADKWLEYVLWGRKFYASNTRKMIPIFQECTEELSRDPNFYKISNTLRVFIYYASIKSPPEQIEIFEFLKRKGIGLQHQLYYESLASVYENCGRYKDASNMFVEGVKKFGKETKIARHFKQFLLRMEHLVKKKKMMPPPINNDESPIPHKKQALSNDDHLPQQKNLRNTENENENSEEVPKQKRVATPDWSGITLRQEKGVNYDTIITPSKQKHSKALHNNEVGNNNANSNDDDDDDDDRMNISLAASAKKMNNRESAVEIFVDNQFVSGNDRRNSFGEVMAYRKEFLSSPESKEEQQFEEERAKLYKNNTYNNNYNSYNDINNINNYNVVNNTNNYNYNENLNIIKNNNLQSLQKINDVRNESEDEDEDNNTMLGVHSSSALISRMKMMNKSSQKLPNPTRSEMISEEEGKTLDEYGMTVMTGINPLSMMNTDLPYEEVTRYVPIYQPQNINPYSKDFREELIAPDESWADFINIKAHETSQKHDLETKLDYRISFFADTHNDYDTPLSKIIEIAKKRLTNDVVLYYLSEVIECVMTLHKCGVVHGELDPSTFSSIECVVDGVWPDSLKDMSTKDAFWKERKLILKCLGDRSVHIDTIPPGKGIAAPWPDTLRSAQDDSSKPWMWDLDAVGICSVAHKMLFGGEPLETITVRGRKKILKGLGTKSDGKLLGKLFDVLLNYENVRDDSPLEEIKKEIDKYLVCDPKRLRNIKSSLTYISTLLN